MRRLRHGTLLLATLACVGLLSCTPKDDMSPENDVAVIPQRGADDRASYEVTKNAGKLNEFKYWSTVQINMFGQADFPEFSDPNDNFQTDQLANGGKDIGSLTVSGDGLNKLGYYRPSNSFDYTSFSTGSNLEFQYTFNSVASNGDMDGYSISDCTDRYLNGFDLGREMGKGTLLVLKRRNGDSAWTKQSIPNFSLTNINSGTKITFAPSGEDVLAGTYFRFVAAYQYYHNAGNYGVVRYRQYYDAMQSLTVYVARGGLTVKFATSETPYQTHKIAQHNYASPLATTMVLDQFTEQNTPVLSSFSIRGQAIKASETSLEIENNVPIYAHNGVSTSLDVILNNNGASFSKEYPIASFVDPLALHSVHPNYKTPLEMNLGAIHQGYAGIDALTQDDEGKWQWYNLSSVSDLRYDRYTFKVSTLQAGLYPLFRAVHVLAATHNGATYLYATVSYFKIIVLNEKSSNYRSLYSDGSGTDSSISALASASTLSDGSVVFGSFSVNRVVSSYRVEYAFNDNSYKEIPGMIMTFDQVGKYRFRVTNSFNEVQYTTIYLMAIGEDNGRSLYFSKYGNFMSEQKRVFDPNSRIPCYGRGSEFYVHAEEDWPGIYGKIMKIYSDGTVETLQNFEDLHEPLSGVINETGQYRVEISNANPSASGERIDYTVSFQIVDETNYTPTLNHDLLYQGYHMSSFVSKVYGVAYKTKGPGSLIYVFPYSERGYLQAYEQALEIESLFVETVAEGQYRYPTYADNPKTYTSRFSIYKDIEANAYQRISSLFIDANEYASDDAYHVEDILELELQVDRYVVSSEEVFESLVAAPVYVNGFAFTQLREYESSNVVMVSPSGERIEVPYDVVVDTLLTESGRYTVLETNWCGTSTYEVYYIAPGEIGATFEMRANPKNPFKTVISQQNIADLQANCVCFGTITDGLDPYGHVVVELPNHETKIYLYEELAGCILDVNGTYHVTAINRLGHRFSFDVVIADGLAEGEYAPHRDPSNPLTYGIPGGGQHE